MIKAVFLDLDGTVYRGSEPCPDAAESIQEFIRLGLHVRYLTNNSGARPTTSHAKLEQLGIPSDPSWITTSGMTAAAQIKQSFQTVAPVGNPGLTESLIEAGLTLVPFEEAESVVVGLCFEFTYKILQDACDAIRNGAAFYATNRDKTYPYDQERFAPGAGSLVAAVEAASGLSPVAVGKPEPTMALDACRALNLNPSEVIFAGDRLDTDIQCAINAGCYPWLVLTGVAKTIPNNTNGSPSLAGILNYLTNS